MKKGVLYSSGQLDCLSYYIKVLPKIKKFVGDRELATKTYVPKAIPPFILHRGSKDPALKASDIKVTQAFLKKRVGKKLHQVEKDLSEKDQLVWRYFVPRKLVEMHYACNYEGAGKSFDRVFIDVDAGKGVDDTKYAAVVKQLLKEIRSDKTISGQIKLIWTGKGIHVYLMLSGKKPHSFYDKYFAFGKNTLTTKWAKAISEKTKVKTKAGHERTPNTVILDTSATPSGKLARVPYSLHLSSKGVLNGVSVPIKEKDLDNLNSLKNLTPDKALRL